jgi:hypothetical protein
LAASRWDHFGVLLASAEDLDAKRLATSNGDSRALVRAAKFGYATRTATLGSSSSCKAANPET